MLSKKIVVLNTRPNSAGKALHDLLEAANFVSLLYPAMEILPLEHSAPPKSTLLIFTSPNAVRYACNEIYGQKPLIAAIGEGTAESLQKKGFAVDITPNQFDSENLLACERLQNVTDDTITIVKGEKGRTLLQETLAARGAKIQVMEVYQRQCPKTEWKPEVVSASDCIIVTSQEILNNILALTPTASISILKKKALLVSSAVLKVAAIKEGFVGPIFVAKNARNESLLQKLGEFQAGWYTAANLRKEGPLDDGPTN